MIHRFSSTNIVTKRLNCLTKWTVVYEEDLLFHTCRRYCILLPILLNK